MSFPMTEKAAFAALVDTLDQVLSRRVTDRALRTAGLDRRVLKGEPGYLPLDLEPVFIEAAARIVGERHLGLIIGTRYSYSLLGTYAEYVLAAPCLKDALERGRRALPIQQPGGRVYLRDAGEYLIISYVSGMHTVNGAHQYDEAITSVLINLVRAFAGDDWTPAWVELPVSKTSNSGILEQTFGAPVRSVEGATAIAVPMTDLRSSNPRNVGPVNAIRFEDLPDLMGLRPPKMVADKVLSLLQMQLLLGDTSVDVIAGRMSLSVRTLERQLQCEGTSFRTLKQRFLYERALELITNTDLNISEVARCLGYREPASFRRAFRAWSGQPPSVFAQAQRAGETK